jgi:hypothetical protein
MSSPDSGGSIGKECDLLLYGEIDCIIVAFQTLSFVLLGLAGQLSCGCYIGYLTLVV